MTFAVALAAVGCMDSGDPKGQQATNGPPSGLPEQARIVDLSQADQTTLCNWWAQTLGGVDHKVSCTECNGDACTDWDVQPSSLSECLADFATYTCSATVHDAEECAFAQAPDLCVFPDACHALDGC
jgi:hypothetical protein